MDNATENAPKRRGRKPKTELQVKPSDIKSIELDEDLESIIKRKTSSEGMGTFRVKLPQSMIDEMHVNIASIREKTKIDLRTEAYVQYALELANENLAQMVRKHLTS